MVVRRLGFQHDADRAIEVLEIGTERLRSLQQWFPMTRFHGGALYHIFDHILQDLTPLLHVPRLRFERLECLDHLPIARFGLRYGRVWGVLLYRGEEWSGDPECLRLGSIVRNGFLQQAVMDTGGLDLVELHTIRLHTTRSFILSGCHSAHMYLVHTCILP